MNSSFSQINPHLQIAWDSTSLSSLKDCPRKYWYSIVFGVEPRQRSFHLTFGILYHQALEAYDLARANGSSHDTAVCIAIRRALRNSWDKALGRPWNSGNQYKNRFTLIRTIVWYLEQFSEDIVETIILANGRPAVELSFRFDFPYTFSTGEPASICGHLDRIGKVNGQPWILDRKTTQHEINDQYFERYSPDNQMSTYAFSGKIVYNIPVEGVIVDAAQVLVNSSRFRRGFAHRTPAQLEEWADDTTYWIAQADAFAKQNYWPMNDKSCFNYGGCPFRPICTRSPEVRLDWLKDPTKYTARMWDPLQVRGDV